MDGFASRQHLDKLVDAPGAGFGLLCVSDPVKNGIPIRTCEHLEHRLRTGIGIQGRHEIAGHFHAGLSGVGGLPSTILFRLPHLVFARLIHSAGSDQPFSDGGVPLRPRAANFSGRETPSKRCGVATLQLTINPAEADRLVQRLVVRERCRISRSLLGQDQPDTLCIGVMDTQPSSPFVSVRDQELWKIHGFVYSDVGARRMAIDTTAQTIVRTSQMKSLTQG